MQASDKDLALAAAGGDRAAFGALVERVYDMVFALSFRMTGHRPEAEDITQDICLALPAKLQSYRGDAKFRTWLYRITVNAVHDRHRRIATQSRKISEWGDVEDARRAETEAANQAREWLTEAMRTLAPDLRDTTCLILEGLSQSEAAEVLGVSEGTVAWRMSQVKSRLRDIEEAET